MIAKFYKPEWTGAKIPLVEAKADGDIPRRLGAGAFRESAAAPTGASKMGCPHAWPAGRQVPFRAFEPF